MRWLAALVLLLAPLQTLAQGYMDQGVYDLKKFVKRSDCDASGLNCDLYPAFTKANAACEKLRDTQGRGESGCEFIVPEGLHRLSQTVQFCRSHTIRGHGNWLPHSATEIFIDRSGFWGRGPGYCSGAGLGTGGGITVMDLSLQGSAAAGTNEYAAGCVDRPEGCGIIGVIAESAVSLYRVSLRGMTMGVLGFADNTAGTWMNHWRMSDVWIETVKSSGIYIQGADSNAGLGDRISVIEACYDFATWTTRPLGPLDIQFNTCSCFNDRSFLGNSYIGTHSRDCIDTVASPDVAHPHFRADNTLNMSVIIGAYAEWGSLPGSFNPDAIAIGGTSTWNDNGTPQEGGRNITGRTDSPHQIRWQRGNNRAATYFNGNEINIFKIDTNGNPVNLARGWHIKYDDTRKSYVMGTGELTTYNSTRSLTFAEQTSSSDGTIVGELRIRCSFAPAFTNPPCVP